MGAELSNTRAPCPRLPPMPQRQLPSGVVQGVGRLEAQVAPPPPPVGPPTERQEWYGPCATLMAWAVVVMVMVRSERFASNE